MIRLSGSRYEPPLEPLQAEDRLLLAAVWFLPWAFGGVEIWASRTAALLLISAGAVTLAKHGWQGMGFERRTRWLLPALLIGLWGIFQVIPVHPVVIRTLSPAADAIYVDTFPGYPGQAPQDMLAALEARALAEVPEETGVPGPPRAVGLDGASVGGKWRGWRTISLWPGAGIDRLFWYFALLCGFLVAQRRVKNPEIAHRYRNCLFILFVALAVFALIYEATSNDKLYWVRSTLTLNSQVGPYVSPTHFGGLMELAVPWLAGHALMVSRRSGEGFMGLLRSPIFSVGAIICIVGGLISGSKFAVLSIVVSLSVLLLLASRRVATRLVVLGLPGLLALLIAVLWGTTRIGTRMQEFVETFSGIRELDRVEVWRAALSMFADYPITGSGFGSFRDVFTLYMPTGEILLWDQLHNDYLEFLVEGGLVAGLLLVWLFLGFWYRCLRPVAWRSSDGIDLDYWGLLLGVAALSVHALTDFNHQIPANALMFVTLAGIAVGLAELGAENRL